MSNRLPMLAAEARQSHADCLHHARRSTESALAAGALLVEAKALCAHGAWAGWLEETGIPERSAQRYMRLHRLALTSDMVTDLGGIAAALRWAEPVRLPPAGKMLAAHLGGFGLGAFHPLAGVWPEGEGFHVGMLDLSPAHPHGIATRRPILGERGVWATLWHQIDRRLAEASFHLLAPDDAPTFAAFIEEMRTIREEASA